MVGTPVSGRATEDEEQMPGYFVNPVCVRTRFASGTTFADHVGDTSQAVAEAVDNQVGVACHGALRGRNARQAWQHPPRLSRASSLQFFGESRKPL